MSQIIFLILLFISGSAFAQINYVLNPDFEDYTKCPDQVDQIWLSKHWNSLDTNGATGVPGVPEYCNTCAGFQTGVGVPTGGYYNQYPHSGKGMAQVVMFSDELDPPPFLYYKRDYVQGRLYRKLMAGKKYCATIFVCLEEGSMYAVQDIGIYLDNGIIDSTKDIGLPQTKYTPQVVNTAGILGDTTNWVKIQGSFIANGFEQFITIGNFKDKAHTAFVTMPLNGMNNSSNISLYLIDDVSVIESDLPAFAGNDRHIGLGDSTYIGRPQEVGLECTWAKLGGSTVIGTGAGIWVKPSTTTSYVVTQTLCGAVKKDTVLVEVWPLGLNSVNGQTQEYSLMPNPNKGRFELVQSVANDEQMQLNVRNILGQRVYGGKAVFKGGKAGLQLPESPVGVYYLRVQNNNGAVWNMKFVKE